MAAADIGCVDRSQGQTSSNNALVSNNPLARNDVVTRDCRPVSGSGVAPATAEAYLAGTTAAPAAMMRDAAASSNGDEMARSGFFSRRSLAPPPAPTEPSPSPGSYFNRHSGQALPPPAPRDGAIKRQDNFGFASTGGGSGWERRGGTSTTASDGRPNRPKASGVVASRQWAVSRREATPRAAGGAGATAPRDGFFARPYRSFEELQV